MTKSDEIRSCRAGVIDNPFQGSDKKVLFVCSMGLLRSPTGARIYANKYNTRSCGVWDDALIPLTESLLYWADEIVFVHPKTYAEAAVKFDLTCLNVKVLEITDEYEHMHPKLIEQFKEQYESHND
jgi:predicted protein tyrosine phosphatase